MKIIPNSGTGSGAITPDGSSVEVYKMIEPGEEPDVVAGQVPAGGSVLDLGAGAGRTRPTDEQMATALEEAGLRLDRFVTDDRVWVKAVPSSAS